MSLDLAAIAERLQESVAQLVDVRERHLNLAANEVLGATSRKVADPWWPDLGPSPVDVVVGDPPTLVAELKWNQVAQDKIYEGIWDLLKIGDLAAQRGCEAWLITGATERTWRTSGFADLLRAGSLETRELCSRHLPGRTRKLAWQDLLDGGWDRAPDCTPSSFELVDPQEARLTDHGGTWLLRAVRIVPGPSMLAWHERWPTGTRPAEPKPQGSSVPASSSPSGQERHPELDRLDRKAGAFLDLVRDELSTSLGADVVSAGRIPRDYLTRRLSFRDTTGRPAWIRLGVAPEGASMNAPGLGDAFFAGIEHSASGSLGSEAREQVEAAGFPARRTVGYGPAHWRHLDLDGTLADQGSVIAQLRDDLRGTGLFRPARRRRA